MSRAYPETRETQRPLLIAIAGASGSGKTTLAEEIARELEGTHFHLDHYYRDLSHLDAKERQWQNFDHPDQLEHELLIEHLRELAEGRSIDRPTYDFATHTRVGGRTERVCEPHVLLIDGIFALHWPEVRALAALTVYVDTPDEICYERRLRRDVRERGRAPEQVAEHYRATVRPMAEQFVRPSARWADLVADGTSSLDWSVEQVLSTLRTRGLLSLTAEEEPLGFS
ncbi:uridine kinase [Acidipila sp. EB88]|uniref:uridine kinase n=1 Tax=Acidipila sp. EB88 TaxID=2305226 RepID=UPI000F5E1F0C|nr:uridine kinase [Acidipila sp. EB88]RRA48744.1 uridine kinase [Acidipila sp. EB88]